MAEPAQRYQDQLKRIKKNIERAATYWKPNVERYHKFQKFVFKSAISAQEADTLRNMKKPVIEFNITNAPVSRLCGEFSKQEPSIVVSAEDGVKVDPETILLVEGHVRHIMWEAKKHNTQYGVYRDQLSGGFSDFKVWTEYAHDMSFDQVIRFGRTFDPTLTGFDPMAREGDKSDAQFCYEMFPMAKEDFKAEYPDVDIDSVQFIRTEGGFNWSYSEETHDVVILVDYYERKKKRKRIVKIADAKQMEELQQEWKQSGFKPGGVMEFEDYKKALELWELEGHSSQPPAIVGEPRWTEAASICRYRVMESSVLEYKETPFKSLPLVYVDGDSVILKKGSEGSSVEQFTRPYVYHAEGIQKMTNFAGQVIANDFENMVMHKFKVAEESLPTEKEFREAYTNYQLPNTLVYKHLWNENPDVQLPAPQEIARVPLPQEVLATFNNSMQMLQNILGSYDASLGINDNQLSGIAIVEAATQSNAAAMPYIVNYMQSLGQVANIIIDLIPKFYKTPRTLPIVGKDGKRDFVRINEPGTPQFNYDENALQVKVEAGVNFAIAKNKALQQIIALMQASPEFAAFINEEGLETLLDNIEFRNVDIVKEKVERWKQKKEQKPDPEQMQAEAAQQQAQAAQQAQAKMLQLEEQKLELKAEETQANVMLKSEQLVNERTKIDNDRLELMQKAGESQAHMVVGLAKAEAEEERARADLHIKAYSQGHEHAHASAKLAKELKDNDSKE